MEKELIQPANSIELARTKDGHYSYHIKCRGDDPKELAFRLLAWQEDLDAKYPVKVKDADSTDK